MPIVAFVLWTLALFSLFPVLKLDIYLSDPFIAAHFFLSYLMLVMAWAFSGAPVAAVLSGLAALLSVYVGLAAHDSAFLLQVLVYGALFGAVALYLQGIQQAAKDKQLACEKLFEDWNAVKKAIEKKNELEVALKRKVGHFLDLQQFSDELKSVSTVEEAAAALVREAQRVIAKADTCALYLVDEERQSLTLAAATHPDPAHPESSIFDQWVMKKSQAILVENAHDDFRFSIGSRASLESRLVSVCASPLVTENKVLGVVRASSASARAFRPEDLRLLDIFSSVGAVTLRNLSLYERMNFLAMHDSLTGLVVNLYLKQKLAEMIQGAKNGACFSLILMDIDFFKRYNDEHGHSAGDLVLKTIASLILKTVGTNDIAARYGGEEFALLLPRQSKDYAMAIAENLRERIEKHVFVLRRAERRVTASFGVAAFPADGHQVETLIACADKRLYQAKNAGRNRVVG